PGLQEPDAVLPHFPRADRRNTGRNETPTAARTGGMATVANERCCHRDRARRRLRIAGSVYPSVPPGVWCLAKHLPPDGRNLLSPAGAELDSLRRPRGNC